MIALSPRSYVTCAFDILFPQLIKYVHNILIEQDNWWSDYVYKHLDGTNNKSGVFTDLETVKRLKKEFSPSIEDWNGLSEHFDETALLRLIKAIGKHNRNLFITTELQFRKLKKIRDEWAHRNYLLNENTKDENCERAWAVKALRILGSTASLIGAQETAHQISALITKMNFDMICENNSFSSHNDLIKFIYDEIISKVENSSTVSKEIQKRILKSWKKLSKNAKTVDEVIDYYWSAVKDKGEIYKELRKCNLPSFEDVSANFAAMCINIR